MRHILPLIVLVTAAALVVAAASVGSQRETTEERTVEREPLTPEEARVILHKGTEPPFSGAFWNHHEPGTYLCRQCGAPLFTSEMKFDSCSGWPSFDDALPGAVREVPDPDGVRTEIVCARCGGHLGHVFRGEGFTPKDTRHCVNSLSLAFEPAPRLEKAYFAGGCFWGVEYWLEQAPGVVSAVSGFMGGHTEHPTYKEVCSGTTGHVETVEVTFDPRVTSYEALAKLFFEIHDPTQVDRQGPDVGDQYRSVVFYTSEHQREVARALIRALEAKGLKVATRVEPAGAFWKAEDSHQDYYERKGATPYCHIRVNRLDTEP